MNVLVCVKRVPVTGGRIVLTDDGRAIDARYLGFTISPHEECGVEEAVRIVEAQGGSSAVLTLGPDAATEQLRDALAVGIERAILLEIGDGEEWDAVSTAAAIVDAVRAQEAAGAPFDLIFFGTEAADTGDYQVGIRVAVALDRPIVSGVKHIAVEGGRMTARREATGGGWEVYEVPLPAVVSVREGLNLPRYPSVPGRLRAKRQPIERIVAVASGCRGLADDGAAAPAGRAGALGGDPGPRAGRRTEGRRDPAPARGGLMILTIVEHAGGRPDRLSLEALVLARRLAAGGGPVHAVLIGEGARAAAAELGGQGVAVAHVVEDPRLAAFAPAAWGAAVTAVIASSAATVVLAPGSDRATEVLAHVAARTGLPMAANVVDVPAGGGGDGPLRLTRQRWAGSLLEDALLDAPVKLLSVAGHAFEPEASTAGRRRHRSRRWLRP